MVIDSLFRQTFVKDLFPTDSGTPAKDSGFYPIYTFAIQNVGTEADDFTLRLRSTDLIYGFDMKRHLNPGEIGIFKTPAPANDTPATGIQYHYPDPLHDSIPFIPQYTYYAFFRRSSDSVAIKQTRPNLAVSYGAIDNGPEGCNTPESVYQIDIDALGKK